MTESTEKETSIENKISKELIDKVRNSARYCYNCNKCVNVCPLAYLGGFNPRDLIIDLIFLTPEETLENNDIWKCLTCGLCAEYCPMTKDNVGVNIPEVIQNLRSLAPKYEPLQKKYLDCHHNRLYLSLPRLMANDKIDIINKLGFLEGTNLKITDHGDIAYFMGCLPFMNGIAPCSYACPANVDVQGYISLTSEGKFQEAIDLIRNHNPLPMVCGRICTEPCAIACNRNFVDDSIGIRSLKRFISDWELKNRSLSTIKPFLQDKEKVAIIGAGPGGLSAAYFLAQMGYKPTIFEAEIYKGGTLRSGIPRYRLPADILDYEIEFIEKSGVEIKTNKPIGPKLTFNDLEKQGYKAFFISIGQQTCLEMKIEGENLKNVFCGLDFLRDKNLTKKQFDFDNKIIGIVGGGNVAMDSARTAKRLGAKNVIIIYRRSREEMPALDEEYNMALEEGIKFEFLTNPIKVIGNKNGDIKEVECIRMKLGEPDPSGRRSPIPIEGSEFKIKIDVLILAIGQRTDLTLLEAAKFELKTDRWGKIETDNITLQTNIPHIFAGGDAIEGEGIAIRAIANGYEAAISINRYLRKIDLKKGRFKKENYKMSPVPKKGTDQKKKEDIETLPIEERIKSFREVELGLSKDSAKKEANRCLKCGNCYSYDENFESYKDSLEHSIIQKCNYGENPFVPNLNIINFLDIPREVIKLLNQNEIIPVVLKHEKCCGHDSLCSGDMDIFEKLANYNVQLFKEAGVKKIIFSCAEGYYTWKYKYEEVIKDKSSFNFEIYHISEYILKSGFLENRQFSEKNPIKVTYHDPCRLGRLSGIYDDPREILKQIPNVELIEMKNIKQDASCCGVSAYINCDKNSKVIQGNRIKEAINTGAEYLIVTCPKCLAHFDCYLNENYELKKQLKVMDLTTFIGKLLFSN